MSGQQGLVDTHAHLMDAAFRHDLEAVLDRARAAGVAALVCVGYDLPTSRAAVALAQAHDAVWATVGIHPNAAAQAAPGDFPELAELARWPRVVGIGETGLDYYRDFSPPACQRAALDWHLDLANRLGLPVVVHNRQAEVDLAPALEAAAGDRPVPGVLHCFASTDQQYLGRMLAAGYTVSFAGPLTYKANAELRALAATVPLGRVVVETDCPYLAPQGHRGRRNEPAHVRETAECLAAVHGLGLEQLAPALWQATGALFPAVVA
jgi:TatD DNase family protein